MPDYRLTYHATGTGETDCNTLQKFEFQAEDDEAAKKAYEEFKEKYDKINREGNYLTKYFVESLLRIDQREKLTQIC